MRACYPKKKKNPNILNTMMLDNSSGNYLTLTGR
uniref:Uncharacterized protein n=1 Tax=Rhizophora mucronata TaxID=61149 RepID=A0A2P2KUA1_RHIMU